MKAVGMNNFITGEISDNEIINRLLKGEKELFEILMRRHNQTLYRAIRSYIRIESDVEDIMQDTYIKAFQNLWQFKANASFMTWLIRIGINEALQNIRKSQRGTNRYKPKEGVAKIVNFQDTSYQMNPEKNVINYEMRLLVEKAIDRLPEKYKIIFILKEVEGMSNAEIASCLQLSDSNVKVRLHRAKGLLKKELYNLSSDTSIFEFGNSRCDKIVNFVMNNII